MKNHLITLALGMAPLVHADLSTTKILESLAPQAVTVSPAAAHPTLASLPSDASLVLTLPQVSKSIELLQDFLAQGRSSLPSSVVKTGSMVQSLSLGLNRDDSDALFELVDLVNIITRPYSSIIKDKAIDESNQPLIALRDRELAYDKERRAAAAGKLRGVTLPTIHLAAQIDSKLSSALVKGLPEFRQMMEQLQKTAQDKIQLLDGIYLTGVKPMKYKGMEGYQFEIDVLGTRKSYFILHQIKDNKLSLIGTPYVTKLKLIDSKEESFLNTKEGRSLAAKQDAHLYIADSNTLVKAATLMMKIMQVESEQKLDLINNQLIKTLCGLAPRCLKGIRASLSLADNPELQVSWQDDKYRFSPMAFKGVKLIESDSKKLFYFENSNFNVPALDSFFNLHKRYTAAMRGYFDIVNAESDEKAKREKEVRSKLAQNRRNGQIAARQLGAKTASGQYCLLEQSPGYEDLLVIGYKDKAAMQSAQNKYQAAKNDYITELAKFTKEEPKLRDQIQDQSSFSGNTLIISEDAKLRQQYEKATGGPTLAGALYVAYKGNLAYYGRMDNKGENFTVKVQMRVRKKK